MGQLKGIGIVVGLALALVAGVIAGYRALPQSLGSVAQGGEYFSTTTGASIPLPQNLLVNGPGALGSVVITGALSGSINFYNATSSVQSFRTGQVATSSIWLGSIPASTAVGTYTFDVNFSNGLLVDLPSNATIPTSTITWHKF